MLLYWILFAIPASIAFAERPLQNAFLGERVLFMIALALVAVMIGMRYEVGADWFSYVGHLDSAYYLSLIDIPDAGDPGYVLLNWLVSRVGGDVWQVNLLCGIIFAYGLWEFTRSQPRPWLALLVAVPYLIVVVAMGYSRQGVAIGLAMVGLAALVRKQSAAKFVLWVLLAAAFHKSAVLLIPIVALTAQRGRVWVVLWSVAATAVGYYVLLEDSVGTLVHTYITSDYESDGAPIRVAMNAVPAAILLVLQQRFPLRDSEARLWTIISWLAVLFVPALFFAPSTAIDRLALYMIPLQLVVLSRVPLAFARTQRAARFLTLGVVLYAAAVMFVWLNYAGHSDEWLPYQFYPL